MFPKIWTYVNFSFLGVYSYVLCFCWICGLFLTLILRKFWVIVALSIVFVPFLLPSLLLLLLICYTFVVTSPFLNIFYIFFPRTFFLFLLMVIQGHSVIELRHFQEVNHRIIIQTFPFNRSWPVAVSPLDLKGWITAP